MSVIFFLRIPEQLFLQWLCAFESAGVWLPISILQFITTFQVRREAAVDGLGTPMQLVLHQWGLTLASGGIAWGPFRTAPGSGTGLAREGACCQA